MRSHIGGLRLLGPGARVSDFDHRREEIAGRRNLAPAPAPFDPVTELTTLQQAGLMSMHESPVKRAIVTRLLEDSQDKPHTPDYRALKVLGLSELKTGKRYHDLTPAGLTAAKTLQQKLCARFDIHLMIDNGQIGWEQKYSCPCGQWSTRVRRSTTSDGNARRSFNRHIATAEGMSKLFVALKPPVRMEG